MSKSLHQNKGFFSIEEWTRDNLEENIDYAKRAAPANKMLMDSFLIESCSELVGSGRMSIGHIMVGLKSQVVNGFFVGTTNNLKN